MSIGRSVVLSVRKYKNMRIVINIIAEARGRHVVGRLRI
jgi:hypothetical protein